MSTHAISQAKAFVQRAELPPRRPAGARGGPRGAVRRGAARDAAPAPAEQPLSPFDAARQQAAVVGADVISFVKAITPEQRQDLVNASLLAQLVANKKVPTSTDLDGVEAWYKEYFNVLSHVGFAVQDSGFAEYTEGGDTFEAQEAIIDIVKTALVGAPAALPIVLKTLESLKNLGNDTPWITVFERESRRANTARFQVSLADSDANGSLLSLFAFGIAAQSTVTQVLFFKFKKNESRLRHDSAKLSVNETVLTAVRDDVTKKIVDFSKSFVAGLDI